MRCGFLQKNNRAIFREQTINAVRYLGTLKEFVGIHIALEDRSNASWFMQDGACLYRTLTVFDFFNEHFSERVMGAGLGLRHAYRKWHDMASLFARLDALRLFSFLEPKRFGITPN